MSAAPKPTLLIVDDDQELRDILAFSFKRLGYPTLTASGGREAFELIKKEKIALVISDVRMPEGDGIELLNKIRDYDVELPVLMFITGYAEVTLEEAYHRGASALLTKPFKREVLMSTVERCLQSKNEKWQESTERMNVDFEVILHRESNSIPIDGKILNLGQGGMFVALKTELPQLNDEVSFRIILGHGPTPFIEGKGIARWVRCNSEGPFPRGFGLEFTSFQDATRGKVIDLIRSLKTKSFIPAK